MYPHLGQVLDLHVHNLVGQAELGNAVFQHAANLMQRLEYIDVVAFLHHVAGEAEASRTGSHDGHLDAIGWSNLRQ